MSSLAKTWRRRTAHILYKWALRIAAGNKKLSASLAARDNEAYFTSEYGIPRVEDFETYVSAYTNNPWINGAIKARADATASAPLRFYRQRKVVNEATGVAETIKELADARRGSIVRAFQRPNPWMTAHDLWEWITGFLLLDGNAYIHFDPRTRELWPLIPSRVRIKPHRTKYIDYYIYIVNGRRYPVPADEVFHFKRFNPKNSYYGMGDIEALYFDLTLDNKMKRYLSSFFDRGARLSGVIEINEDVNPDEQAKIEFQFNNDHGGSDQMHKIAFLAEGMKWVQTGQTNRELQIGDLALISRDSAMAIFRTPPALLGRWEQARFSNAREQVRLFFEGVQVAFWRKLEAVINLHPLLEESNLVAEFDILQVPQLRESDNEKAERGRILVQSGQMTINEVRRIYWGLPPVAQGDQIIVPKTGRNEDAGNNEPKDEGEKDKDDKDAEELINQGEKEMQDLAAENELIRERMEQLELQEVN